MVTIGGIHSPDADRSLDPDPEFSLPEPVDLTSEGLTELPLTSIFLVTDAGTNEPLAATTTKGFDIVNWNFSRADIQRIRGVMLEEPFSTTETGFLFSAYVLVAVLGLIGNGLVCLAVLRNRQMRTTRNVFITNLSLANLMLAILLVPFILMPKLQQEWVYGNLPCKLFNVLPGTNTFCSALTIIACAADRYYAVTSRRITDALKVYQAVLIAVAIWAISFTFCAPYALYCHVHDWSVHPERPEVVVYQTCTCEPPNDAGLTTTIIAVSKFMFLFPMPLLCLVLFNLLLSRFLSQNRQMNLALRNPARGSCGANSSRLLPNRTTVLLYSMAASYALLWMPFEIWNLLADSVMKHDESFVQNSDLITRLDATFNLLAMVSICVNPLLYGYLNANFNREFKKIFRDISNSCHELCWETVFHRRSRKTCQSLLFKAPPQAAEMTMTLLMNNSYYENTIQNPHKNPPQLGSPAHAAPPPDMANFLARNPHAPDHSSANGTGCYRKQ